MSEICAALKVVEMGAGSIAASMAGMVLADAGARVLKVEPPAGDRLRDEVPSGFLVWNRGKESVVADLRTPEGQERLRDLARAADVVIEAFSPGTTDSWGIAADVLCAANPALVHCSITGFGPVGPYANVKGYDPLVAAKVGLFARGGFGHRDGPIHYPVPWGSFGAGMQSVAGILGALMVREQTGRGQRLGATLVAGLDPVDYFVSTVAQLMVKRGEEPALDARTTIGASRYGVLVATKDGRFIQTSTLLPHQGQALTKVAGIDHVLDDPRFAQLPKFASAEDAQEWEDMLWEAFRQEDLEHWLPLLEASPDVAFEVAATSEEGTRHPQIVHNGDVVAIEDEVHGPVRQVGPIAHFSDIAAGHRPIGTRARRQRRPVRLHGRHPPAADRAGASLRRRHDRRVRLLLRHAVRRDDGRRPRRARDQDRGRQAVIPTASSFGAEVATNKTTAGKESISIDLRSPAGREIAQQICAKADVFVTGFRSGVADKLGLGYDELRELNPRLVYLHAAGYGTDGPYAHRALYAQAAQAVAGSFGRQVGYWADPAQNEGMSVDRAAGHRRSPAQPGRRRRLQRRPRGPRRARTGHLPPAPHRPGPVRAHVDDQRQRLVLLRRLLHLRRQTSRPPLRQRVLRDERPRPRLPDRRGWVCLAVRSQGEFDRPGDHPRTARARHRRALRQSARREPTTTMRSPPHSAPASRTSRPPEWEAALTRRRCRLRQRQHEGSSRRSPASTLSCARPG